METVWVTNGTGIGFQWEWDGRLFAFKMGEPIEVPLLFAQSVLGYGQEEKYDVVVRLGWTRTLNDLPEALARLDKIEFVGERPDALCAPSPAQGLNPAPVLTRWGRGKGTRIVA